MARASLCGTWYAAVITKARTPVTAPATSSPRCGVCRWTAAITPTAAFPAADPTSGTISRLRGATALIACAFVTGTYEVPAQVTRQVPAAVPDVVVVRAEADVPAARWGRSPTGRPPGTTSFTDLMDHPPMAYLAEWRLSTAADQLRGTRDGAEMIGRRVGYVNPFAFSTAFERRFGGGSPGVRFRRISVRSGTR